MKPPLCIFAAALSVSLSIPLRIQAATVAITPDQDTTIFAESGTLSNGAGSFLFAGSTNGNLGTTLRRALVSFNVAGSVPAGATIDSVILTLTVSQTVSGNQSVSLHRVTQAWGQAGSNAAGEEGRGAAALLGDATWSSSVLGSSTWAAAGGDFVSGESASAVVAGTGSTPIWSSPGMVADVQSWLDAPTQNFGWILIGNEGINATAKRFNSSENGLNAPSLQIEFTPIPEPSAGLLLIVGVAITNRRRRTG